MLNFLYLRILCRDTDQCMIWLTKMSEKVKITIFPQNFSILERKQSSLFNAFQIHPTECFLIWHPYQQYDIIDESLSVWNMANIKSIYNASELSPLQLKFKYI